jgi:hypothetical protein
MKKLTTIFTAAVMFIAVSAFANKSDEVPGKVKTAFENNFSSALDITWEKGGGLYFASFKLNAFNVTAAYNDDGELMSTSRKLSFGEMPMNIAKAISDKYKGYSIAENVTEVNTDDQLYYTVIVNNEKKVIVLKCYLTGEIAIEAEAKK